MEYWQFINSDKMTMWSFSEHQALKSYSTKRAAFCG